MPHLSPEVLPWAQGLALTLLLGLALALVVGLLLLIRPHALFTLNQRLSRWVDTRATFRMLDQPRHLERFFYRHHRTLGVLIVAGATYVLLRWALAYDRADLLVLLGPRWASRGMDWIPQALETVLVALHGGILVVGLLVIFRPSLLKGVEKAANRWQESPGAARLDAVVGNLDETFEGHPRVTGVLLLVSATWCLMALAPALVELLRR